MWRPQTVTGASTKNLKIATNRLRYELELENQGADGAEKVFVVREAVLPIADANDPWVKDQIPTKSRKSWVVREKRPPYIMTEDVQGQQTIFMNQDMPGGGREAFNVGELTRTAISNSNALRQPTAAAARQEMLNWRFLQLNPLNLRSRAVKQPFTALLPDGSNLAATINYLSRQNDGGLNNVLKDMTGFITDLKSLLVKPIADREEFLLEFEMQDGSKFSSGVLSDGTLRLLALVTLKNDSRHQGVICFEEPENGVQPQRLKQIADVLHGLGTNFTTQTPERGLRQILVNTHSPGLLASVPSDSLYYVGMKMHEKGRQTHIVPVRAELFGGSDDAFYTWEQVRQFLDTDSINQKREELGL